MEIKKYKNIFFYDGDCGFCDSTVMFLMDRTASNKLYFSSLQSTFSETLLAENGIENPVISTAYFYDGTAVFKESDAIMKSLLLCKRPTQFLGFFLMAIPSGIRNYFYRLFAKNRIMFSLHLKKECRLLSSEERVRFII